MLNLLTKPCPACGHISVVAGNRGIQIPSSVVGVTITDRSAEYPSGGFYAFRGEGPKTEYLLRDGTWSDCCTWGWFGSAAEIEKILAALTS